MSEATSKTIPWARILVEGVVIVGSILLAFAIDAAWDNRNERVEEREALAALREDFTVYEQIATAVASRSVPHQLRHSEYLLSLPEGPAELDLARADSAFRWIIAASTVDPGERTLESLLSTGRLQIIRNEELRFRLSSWPTVVDEFQDDERVIREFVRQSLVPYLARAGVPLNRVYDVIYPARPDPVVSDTEALSIYARVVRDPEFRSLLAYRHNWELDRQGSFRSTLEFVESVLELLEAELGG